MNQNTLDAARTAIAAAEAAGITTDDAPWPKLLPPFDLEQRCPDHPLVPTIEGYGYAGGGYGPYTMCRKCIRVVSKSEGDGEQQ